MMHRMYGDTFGAEFAGPVEHGAREKEKDSTNRLGLFLPCGGREGGLACCTGMLRLASQGELAQHDNSVRLSIDFEKPDSSRVSGA